MKRQLIVQPYQAQVYTQEQEQADSLSQVGEGPYMAFNAKVFPLLGFLLGLGGILWTYYVAVSKSPPDVKPFPWTDITHTAIHFPEYIIFRIALLASCPIFALTFQTLKNYLEMKNFEILGAPEPKLESFGTLSTIACFALCVSTATISDGGDMNWTAHTIGASSFFVITLFQISRASKIYRNLWPSKRGFCPNWSYQIKKYSNFILLSIVLLQLLDMLKLIEIGSFVEWYAAFYTMAFVLTLYWDFEGMEIALTRG